MNRVPSVLLGCLLTVLAVAGLAVVAARAALAQLERETLAAQVWTTASDHSG